MIETIDNSRGKRRQTVSDGLITKDIFQKIIKKTLSEVEDIYNISQIEIVNILLPKKLSNNMIAKVINDILPEANATQGSVASLIKHIKNKDDLLQDLLDSLEVD